jgi:hypothetical protein
MIAAVRRIQNSPPKKSRPRPVDSRVRFQGRPRRRHAGFDLLAFLRSPTRATARRSGNHQFGVATCGAAFEFVPVGRLLTANTI